MNDKKILIKNIDNEIAIGDINCLTAALSTSPYKSILDSNMNEYAINRKMLNINAEQNPTANNIKNDAP